MDISVAEDDTIKRGYCVYLVDDQPVYAGRIKDSPSPTPETLILLHPDDYNWLVARFEAHTIH